MSKYLQLWRHRLDGAKYRGPFFPHAIDELNDLLAAVPPDRWLWARQQLAQLALDLGGFEGQEPPRTWNSKGQSLSWAFALVLPAPKRWWWQNRGWVYLVFPDPESLPVMEQSISVSVYESGDLTPVRARWARNEAFKRFLEAARLRLTV